MHVFKFHTIILLIFVIEPSEIESSNHSGFVLVKFTEDEYLSIVPVSNITDTNVNKLMFYHPKTRHFAAS